MQLLNGASEGMGIRGILWDMGLLGRISVSTDASAAQGVASRRGLGKVKNIELNQSLHSRLVIRNKMFLYFTIFNHAVKLE